MFKGVALPRMVTNRGPARTLERHVQGMGPFGTFAVVILAAALRVFRCGDASFSILFEGMIFPVESLSILLVTRLANG